MLQKTLLYGLIIALVLAAITLFLPVELYDGYAIMADGERIEEKLSLSYFVNKSSFLSEYQTQGVKDIKLRPIGMILVFIINIGFPFLLGYRIALAKKQETENED
jgi:Na+-driven multidrug efflux pump